MKPETKLTLRRWMIRQVIKLVDRAEEWLHQVQVQLRNNLSLIGVPKVASLSEPMAVHSLSHDAEAPPKGESFGKWEARRSGVAPVSKKAARQRRERQGAAAFDLRYAR